MPVSKRASETGVVFRRPFETKSTLRVNRFQSAQGISVGCACVQGDSGCQRAGDFAFSRARFGGCGGMYADAAFATGSDGDGDGKVYAHVFVCRFLQHVTRAGIVLAFLDVEFGNRFRVLPQAGVDGVEAVDESLVCHDFAL